MDQTTKHPERRRLDPAKTRQSILEAAFNLFAEKGYEGTSIADIGAAVGVPKSLVQYHFGSKEQLWNVCLAERAAPMLAAVDRFIVGETLDVAELVETRFKLLRDNPKIARILAWASMSSAPVPDFIRVRRDRVLHHFDDDPTGPKFARLLVALAATDGWFFYRQLYSGFVGEAVFDEKVEQQLLELLIRTATNK